MYSKSKYVIGKMQLDYSVEVVAVVVPENVPHRRAARLFLEGTITSAGFCHYSEDDVRVYGESSSLCLKSDPENDKKYVGRALAHPKYASDFF